MSWLEKHGLSESFASQAEIAEREARTLYFKAAEQEELALHDCPVDKIRTLGITAVSAVALYLKSGNPHTAIEVGNEILEKYNLPEFARIEISEILRGLGD